MSRMLSKKATEKRKKTRGRRQPPLSKKSRKEPKVARELQDKCSNCVKSLKSDSKALFVEEEVGRVFCSEGCITEYFSHEISKMEKEYFSRLSSNDLTGEEREKYAHLRWVTLEDPDEVWREKTISGDYRYTLISEFKPESKPVWSVCICLFLRGEPSFLYLAFSTRNGAMVNFYRRGERIQWMRAKDGSASASRSAVSTTEESQEASSLIDGLADSWTEDETIRAQINQRRRLDDIPSSEFELYQGCFEETLESPNEVWSLVMSEEEPQRLYHFIRFYPEGNTGVWYVIVARETEDVDQLEILDAFPTRDTDLVERFRRGEQEVGETEVPVVNRLVH